MEEPESLRALVGRLTDHTALAEAIEKAIDEEALIERTQEAERKAAVTETLGAAAAEKDEEVGTAADRRTEGLWGKDEPWAIRPE